MPGYEGPRTPHERVVAYEIDRNMQSAIDTMKAAATLGVICVIGYLGYQGLEALQGNQDRCSELRLEAHQNGQPASHLSFIADNGVEVRCY